MDITLQLPIKNFLPILATSEMYMYCHCEKLMGEQTSQYSMKDKAINVANCKKVRPRKVVLLFLVLQVT